MKTTTDFIMRSTTVTQPNKRATKISKMKTAPIKKKRKVDTKNSITDSISDTISFVIKGKLTPIKPVISPSERKQRIIKNSQQPLSKVDDIVLQKTVAKAKIKINEVSKAATKVQIKTAKKPSALKIQKKQIKKEIIDEELPPPPVVVKNVKPPTVKTTEKVKLTNKQKCPKKETKTKIVTNKKSNPVVVRNKNVTKGNKQNQKVQNTKSNAEQKKSDDLKTQLTIKKLLLEANKSLKPSSLKYVKTKNKKKTNPTKETKDTKKVKQSKLNTKRTKSVKPSKSSLNSNAPLEITTPTVSPNSPPFQSQDSLPLKNLITKPEVKSNKPKIKEKINVKSNIKKPKMSKVVLIKKRIVPSVNNKDKVKRSDESRSRKMKLLNLWNSPKRHRVASLNALAKVHCLYENETRSNILDGMETTIKKESGTKNIKEQDTAEKKFILKSEDEEEVAPTRILRSVPGLRAIGKHWDMHDTTSSSEDTSGNETDIEPQPKPPSATTKVKVETNIKKENQEVTKPKKRRRNRTEIFMDLKDMVVRKRMASLNATAILAASYCVEKRPAKLNSQDDTDDTYSSDEYFAANYEDDDDNVLKDKVKKEEDPNAIEVRSTPNNKVVIVNQDTDVTITGVYVNSTTRSTHHEGYCSIAGMQYRISATSHTQTAATAVATETLLQPSSSSSQENSNSESLPSSKSYTPLDALSNMQPPPGPGTQQHSHPVVHHGQHLGPPQHVLPMPPHQLSPSLRHGCTSAFSSPHAASSYPPPPPHVHHPPPPPPHEPGYAHGYYQPAGPLITVPHGHGQPPIITKSAPLSEASPTSNSPPTSHQPPPPSSNGDSSDSEVIITSVTSAKEGAPPAAYRYSQYPAPPPSGYSYGYPPHYYPTPPPPPPSSYSHHEICYSNPYLHHKYAPATYRRYLPNSQYYPPGSQDVVYPPPTSSSSQPSQQVVTSPPVAGSATAFQGSPSGPPPPTLIETYPAPPPNLIESYQPPPPPPHHYYTSGYGPPSCYTHSPPSRTLPFINAAYQNCPCPMQSCPKNVLTGPLTGDSKRSNISSIAKDSMPLPPVALALPLEPASATGPPSPARGSAGMPPPPSPAGATYQQPPPPPKQESVSPEADCKPMEKKRKARIGKAMVRNNIAANIGQNTMLLMCNPATPDFNVKREIESPKEKEQDPQEQNKELCSDEDQEIKFPPNSEPPEIDKEPPPPIIPENNLTDLKEEEQEFSTDQNNTPSPPPAVIKSLPSEELQPCVLTVAENVKVKNMKRKMSLTKEKVPEPEVVPCKKPKYSPGSYKDFIRKNPATIKINNGKRKLIGNPRLKSKSRRSNLRKRTKLKSSTTSQKQSQILNNKRKNTKTPLTASNLHNSKINNNKKERATIKCEPKTNMKRPKAAAIVNNSKSTSATILDNLFAKNNVDRTIESVVHASVVTTNTKESSALKPSDKCGKTKESNNNVNTNKKSTNVANNKNGQLKSISAVLSQPTTVCKKTSSRRQSKCKEIVPLPVPRAPRKSLQMPRWSNGWRWEGEPYEAKVFLNSDEVTVVRRCFPAMRHNEGDKIEVRDCVLLKAGARKNELPFVAKIAALWENPEDGEMMMSILWYYRPEHTEQGRLPTDQPDEVFASRHKDSNSVACIDDKCYVLTFNEYCRYRKNFKRLEERIEEPVPCIPIPEPYPRSHRQPPSPLQTSPEMVFFCRRVYDFRQKRIVKNPS